MRRTSVGGYILIRTLRRLPPAAIFLPAGHLSSLVSPPASLFPPPSSPSPLPPRKPLTSAAGLPGGARPGTTGKTARVPILAASDPDCLSPVLCHSREFGLPGLTVVVPSAIQAL